MVQESEQELVNRANAGDRSALEAMYRLHRDWVLGLAIRFVRHRPDALDILQDVFIYFFGRFPGFELTATLRAYLYPVTRSHAMSHLRKKRKVVALRDDADGPKHDAAIYEPEHWQAEGDFEKLLDKLPQPQREVVALRFGSGLKLEEIAEVLKVPKGTVKSRLHHALMTLRRKFPELGH